MNSKLLKKIVAGIIVIGILIAGISGIRFTSVSQHNREQESLKHQLTDTQSQTWQDTQGVTESGMQPSTHQSTQPQTQADSQQVTQNITQTPTQTPTQAETISCKISISCKTLADNIDALTDHNLAAYVPENGAILEEVTIKVPVDATAYDVLTLACKAFDIQLEAKYTAVYNTCYVKGIGYLYEKNAGSMSGWIYKVNQKTPGVGASGYKVKDGDVISWHYTIDGGKDVS